MASSAASRTISAAYVAFIALSVILHCLYVEAACQSCLLAAPIPFIAGRHHAHHHRHAGRVPANAGEASWAFGALMTRQFLSVLDSRNRKFLESSDDADKDVAGDGEATEEKQKTGEGAKVEVTAAMVASIGFYKKFISPLLPPACRFLPTCSQYGVQAIEQFGPTKGAILTAWRLLRCSPLGGRGYDPPKWPPVAFNYGSY